MHVWQAALTAFLVSCASATGPATTVMTVGAIMRSMRQLGLVAAVVVTLMLVVSASVASPSTPSSSRSSSSNRLHATAAGAEQAQSVDSVHFLSSKVGWASVGNSARLLMTTDGGAHWRDVSPPMLRRTGFGLTSGLVGADFLSPTDFFVNAHGPGAGELLSVFLLHTKDGGSKWTEVGSFLSVLDEAWVSFVNDRQGWVAISGGAAGGSSPVTIHTTSDGGAHWDVVARSTSLIGKPGTPDNPGGCHDTGLTWSGSLRTPDLWLTGGGNVMPCVWESTEGGRRWRIHRSLDPSAGWGGTAWPPVFSSESHGALAVWYGTPHDLVTAFYSTTNGGASWVGHRAPSPKPELADVVSPTTWFAATGGTIYRTTDAGTSWSSTHVSLSFSNSEPSNAVDFVNAVDGWAVLGGTLWHTTDGGHIWVQEVLPT